ncbi:hypothetical protein DL770_007294 [Monosporascus sp. CRB-9-2]|nr:hypothetical protein DL770_007294 [Monosporascus sp. CRB-9-2]
MGNGEILLPNGTCYRSRDAEADGEFMPCGNAGYFNSHFACCSSGDQCLSSNACYNFKRDITYIAGCTDPAYSHPSCPRKLNYASQEWVMLWRCGNSNNWSGCKGPDFKSPKDEPTPCDCLDNNQILLMGSLSTIAVLPTAPGETIAYLPGQTPTMQSAFSSPPTATSTPTSSVTPDTELSLGTKAGFGAGAVVGALLIGDIIYLALLLRKRKKKGGRQQDHAEQPPAPPQTTERSTPAYAPLSTSPSLTGFKSELAADELPRVPLNIILSSDSSWTQPQHDSQQRYEAYDPRIHGDYSTQQQSFASELFSAPSRYGQYAPAPVSPQQAGHPPPFPPIAELQG